VAKLSELSVKAAMYVVSHSPRNAYTTRGTLGLESCRDVDRITVQVSSIDDSVADVDSNTEEDGSIRRMIPVMDRNLFLHLHGTSHCPVNAAEDDQQGIATGLNNLAAILLDGGID
jgi:hypothetical protein